MIKPIHKCSDVMKSSQQREGGYMDGKKIYLQIRNNLKPKYRRLYNEGKMDKIKRQRMFTDEVNKIFVEGYGLEYGREDYQ